MSGFLAGSFFLGLATLGAGAAAAPEPVELLGKVDAALASAVDQNLGYDLVTQEAGKPDRLISFEVTVKGKDWRRVEFLAPADVKGTRMLVLSPTQSYIYLPAFRKVRRIASHVKEQGFLGTAYDQDEVSLASFSELFTPTAVRDLGDRWGLTLVRKANVDFRYAKIEVEVRKDIFQPVELRYFDEAGNKIKTEKRADIDCEKKICAPRTMEMVDHSRGDLKSRMLRRKWKLNQGIADEFFTVRALQQGG